MLRKTLDLGTSARVDAADSDPHLVAAFLRWSWWRAAFHRGWWLVTSVYLVVDAGLSPSQLVLIGIAQALVALVLEVPAGVLADAVSRKWSLVVSHLLMGTAMIATGLVTDFAALVATQMLWGASWTFASGAEVAWITDELADRTRIPGVLVRSGRAQLTGAAAGLAGVGALGSLAPRSTAMVLAGTAMLLLGVYVLRFPERRFLPAATRRWSATWSILVRGATLARRSRPVLLMFAATFLVSGAGGAFGRVQPRRLVDLGLPTDPVAWFTGLGLVTLLAGALALRVVERWIDDEPLRGYVVACALGALGAAVLAGAAGEVTGSVAVVFVMGLALPVTRTIGTIWVNRRTSGDVRATVLSLLALAEYAGVIACGVTIAALAGLAGLSPALAACGALFTLALAIISAQSRRPNRCNDRPTEGSPRCAR